MRIHNILFLLLFVLIACGRKEMKQKLIEYSSRLDSLNTQLEIKSDSIVLYQKRLDNLINRDSVFKQQKSSRPLAYINSFKRMYPFEVKLYTRGVLAQRLRKLLGEKEFKRFKKFNYVQTPIQIINDDRTSIFAIAAQGGGSRESFLYLDFVADEISVALYEEGKLEYYTEQNDKQRSKAKRDILKWMIENRGVKEYR